MKVFPLHLGDTKVPFRQFYFGPWAGWLRLPTLYRDQRRIVVPIYAYLIDHPRAGLMLVDAGLNWDMAHNHRAYYPGITGRVFLEEDEYRLTREQELSAHLARLGYRIEDIQTVLITHIHEDHLGELRGLPHADMVMSEGSWNERLLFRPLRDLMPSFPDTARSWQLMPYSSGPLLTFSKSQDLLGDGTIVLLPTPGHTAGHMAVLIQMDGYQLLLAGDLIYTLRHMAVDQVLAVAVGGRAQTRQIASIRQLQLLREALPEMVILPCHDHTAYQFELIEPFLSDGVLSSDERQAIKDYEASLFDSPWHLPESAMPSFISDQGDDTVGRVAEPQR